jgi:hypothetical protein
MTRTDITSCDIDLTAIMDDAHIINIRRVPTPDGRFFEVTLATGFGYGMTVGQALANAQRQPLQVAA